MDIYLTRAQFAARCGLSVAEIRRRENVGLLAPAKRGERNNALYVESQIQEQEALTRRPAGNYRPEEAKVVFEALRSGKTPTDIVIDLGIHPKVVAMAVSDYATLQGGFWISKAFRERIESILPDGAFPPLGDARSLYDTFEILIAEHRNHLRCRCGKDKQACLSCARSEVVKRLNKQFAKARKQAERTKREAVENEDYEQASTLGKMGVGG